MEKYTDYEPIIILLKRYLEGDCDAEAKAQLDEWLQASEKNRELFQRIKSRRILAEKFVFCEHTDKQKDWNMICQRAGISSSLKIVKYWYRYAAIIAGIGLASWFLYSGWEKTPQPQILTQAVSTDSILPGFCQAYIQLATGERIRLGDTLSKVEKEIEGSKLMEAGNGLVVTSGSIVASEEQDIRFNKLEVPRGGEYELMLADGTKVWLNSDSELEFPLAFTGNERLVRLKGEAYFEVKRDEQKPFKVELNGMEILVLGTSFNIYAYNNQVNATLVKGSVEIYAGDGRYKLIPGEQASLCEGGVKIEKVDVADQIAWKEGKFVFRSKRLEEVMAILGRWYNLDVVYQNTKVKDLHFTGNIPRHATISELLKFLERTHLVNFTIKGRTVIVSE